MRAAGDFVSRRGAWVLGAWLALALALWGFVPSVDPARNESITFLPPEARSQQAADALARHFPAIAGQSEAVVIFERAGALTRQDSNAIESLAGLFRRQARDPNLPVLRDIHVLSPASIPLSRNPLVSPVSGRGQAAIIRVEIPANFVTIRSSRVVGHIRAVLAAATVPNGLKVHVTGSSGYGADYALAAQKSNERSFLVTISAVLIILIVVYRAPLAAAVPLGAVTLAAAIVLKLLDLFSQWGLHAGTAERTFVFVLLYGAGTDYSLLLVSRYREFLRSGSPHRQAVADAWNGTMRAILASGMTNTIGLLALCAARFRIYQTTGPAIAVAMAVMMLAALTLVPAMLALAGPVIFWPRRTRPRQAASGARAAPSPAENSRFWQGLAVLVTARPLAVLAVCAAILCAPAVAGARVQWVYDQLTTLAPTYDAVRGKDMALRHWGVGQLSPVTIVLEANRPLDAAQWEGISRDLADRLASEKDVEDVRALTQPVGRARAAAEPASAPSLLAGLGGAVSAMGDAVSALAVRVGAQKEYLSEDRLAVRLVVILAHPALSREAMQTVHRVRARAEELLAPARGRPSIAAVHVAGATPEIDDVSDITTADFHRIAFLVVALICLILFALLRKVLTALFMAVCTVLSYLAVLGVTEWVFVGLLGAAGLDWKVQVFLFVVMVAVGVDYSIFLGARMVEEARSAPTDAAIRRAVIHTGPVISSCGVIMAATLGSLMTGDLALLHQLGFAMALGMLLDTFLIRPLLIPSFAAIFWRRAGLRVAPLPARRTEPPA